MEITKQTLLSVSGIAFLTAIALQLLIKPWLTKLYADKAWHDIAMNIAATGLAVTLAIIGLYVADIFATGQSVAFAAVQGLVAAFLAVYGYEGAKNLMTFVNYRKSVGGDGIGGDKVEGNAISMGDVSGDVSIDTD